MVWLFAVVWGTDTLAFFGGRAIGGPKLAPRLSPSKTWSGFAVGVCSGALLGLLVAPRPVCALCVVAAGVVGGAVAQAGDLFESSLKRQLRRQGRGIADPGPRRGHGPPRRFHRGLGPGGGRRPLAFRPRRGRGGGFLRW